jgi:hypothetical protein
MGKGSIMRGAAVDKVSRLPEDRAGLRPRVRIVVLYKSAPMTGRLSPRDRRG